MGATPAALPGEVAGFLDGEEGVEVVDLVDVGGEILPDYGGVGLRCVVDGDGDGLGVIKRQSKCGKGFTSLVLHST